MTRMFKSAIKLFLTAAPAVVLAACATSGGYSRFATQEQWKKCVDDAITESAPQCGREGFGPADCPGSGVVELVGIPACGYAPPPIKLTPELIEWLSYGCKPDSLYRRDVLRRYVPPPAGDPTNLFTYMNGEAYRRPFYVLDPRSPVMRDALEVCKKFYFDPYR